MKRVFGYIFITLLWLEVVYHVAIFELNSVQPLLLLAFTLFLAGIETLCVGLTKKRGINLGILWGMQGCNFILFAVQLVYHEIFTQPLLLETAFITGADAITDFWSVALDGVARSLVPLLLMLIPLVIMAVLLKKNVLKLNQHKIIEWALSGGFIVAGASLVVLLLMGAYMH